jgi:hypothetical protein
VSEAAPGAAFSARLFEFCSGLVDLVVGVGRHGGGGHRLALAGERFVGLVAEDLAEVGKRPGGFCEAGYGPRNYAGGPGDRSRRLVSSKSVKECSKQTQNTADYGVARVVIVADRDRKGINGRQRIAI